MREPRMQTIRRIEKILKTDIKWAVEKGLGFNPEMGAQFGLEGVWEPAAKKRRCGVCPIGAHVIRMQPKVRRDGVHYQTDVDVAAKTFRLDFDWMYHLYTAVAYCNNIGNLGNFPPKCLALAKRLRRYGDRLMIAKKSK